LTNATDVLEFKLTQVWQKEAKNGLEGKRRAVDSVLRIIALGRNWTRQSDLLKRELMITRIAQRFGVKEETVWGRLKELQAQLGTNSRPSVSSPEETRSSETAEQKSPASGHERQLLEVLLAEPKLVSVAAKQIEVNWLTHPGVRQLIEGLYRLEAEGMEPTLDHLRTRINNPALIEKALQLQERGLANPDRASWLEKIVDCFRDQLDKSRKQELQTQLKEIQDREAAMEILRQIQNRRGS